MSKRHSRVRHVTPSGKRLAKPLWIAVGLIIIAGVALLLLSNRSPERAAVPVEVSGAPRVSVVQDTIDHGTVRFETTVESVFQVRNVGDRDLVIQGEPRVELVEGC